MILEEQHFFIGLNSLHLPRVQAPVISLMSCRDFAPFPMASIIFPLLTLEQYHIISFCTPNTSLNTNTFF
jgi:hypothetical protein